MDDMPYSKEIEECLLGSLILGEEARINLSSKIKESDWYLERNKITHKAICDLENRKEVVDLVTVADKIRSYNLEWFDDVSTHVSKLVNKVPTWRNYEAYADKLLELSKRREAIKVGDRIKQLGYDNELELDQLTAQSEEIVFDFSSETEAKQDYVAVQDFAVDHMNDIWNRKNEEGIVGIETPFIKLNEITGGLRGNKLVVIAAKPGMGKTTVADNICDFAEEQGKSAGIFSLEMTKEELVERRLAKRSNVEFKKMERGLLSDSEKEIVQQKYIELYEDNKIIIDDKENLSIEEIRSKARRMHREHNIELVMIDYLQLIRDDKHESKADKFSHISREAKNMAKELDITVILISQLSRSTDSRNDKRPIMSDLKGSSGIEDAADIIIFLYRESFYNRDIFNIPELKYMTEVIIEKYRQGQTGFFVLDFDPRFYKFFDAPDWKVKKYTSEVFG